MMDSDLSEIMALSCISDQKLARLKCLTKQVELLGNSVELEKEEREIKLWLNQYSKYLMWIMSCEIQESCEEQEGDMEETLGTFQQEVSPPSHTSSSITHAKEEPTPSLGSMSISSFSNHDGIGRGFPCDFAEIRDITAADTNLHSTVSNEEFCADTYSGNTESDAAEDRLLQMGGISKIDKSCNKVEELDLPIEVTESTDRFMQFIQLSSMKHEEVAEPYAVARLTYFKGIPDDLVVAYVKEVDNFRFEIFKLEKNLGSIKLQKFKFFSDLFLIPMAPKRKTHKVITVSTPLHFPFIQNSQAVSMNEAVGTIGHEVFRKAETESCQLSSSSEEQYSRSAILNSEKDLWSIELQKLTLFTDLIPAYMSSKNIDCFMCNYFLGSHRFLLDKPSYVHKFLQEVLSCDLPPDLGICECDVAGTKCLE